MARVCDILVGQQAIVGAKCSNTAVDDDDINKPVKLSATGDIVTLAADGEEIYGFINSVERHTEDGYPVVGVQITGRKWVLMNGTYAIGDLVEAADNTAAGVANAAASTASDGNWSICQKHALVDDDTVAALVASMFNNNWQVIYGPGTDGSKALIEKC